MTWRKLDKGAWSGASYWRGKASEPRVDARLVWADATRFADLASRPPEWVPVLIELRDGVTAKDFAQAMREHPSIRISALYGSPPRGLEKTRFCTALVKRTFFAGLGDTGFAKQVERLELGFPGAVPVTPETSATQPPGALPGVPVVVAIIDDGFAVAHRRFRDGPRSTRFQYVWLQDGSPELHDTGYGREITKADIDGWLLGASSEDAVYRTAMLPGMDRRAAHGTHVLDLACGEEPTSVPKTAPGIMAVQLPARPNWGGTPLGAHILDGLRYVIHRADRIDGDGEPVPVVVNLSFANNSGPHDGSSILERAMDELIDARKGAKARLAIVLPSGNAHLSRCHAHFALTQETFDLKWRVPPDCRTPALLEIWLPKTTDPDDIGLRVTPPDADPSMQLEAGEAYTLDRDGSSVCTVVFLQRVANGDGHMILVAVAPTFLPGSRRRPTAPSGTWKITLVNKTTKSHDAFNAWIQRNEPVLGGPPHARQSRFEDEKYERNDHAGNPRTEDNASSYVKRAGTLNGIATGSRTFVIGAYRGSDGTAAPYSAAGASWLSKPGPEAAAIGDDAASARGVRAAGTRSGSTVVLTGTSVAVPQVTRWIASEFARDRDVTLERLREEAKDHEYKRKKDGRPYRQDPSVEVTGAGRLSRPEGQRSRSRRA